MNKWKNAIGKTIKMAVLMILTAAGVMYIGKNADANEVFSVKYNLTGLTVSPKETTVDEGSSMSMVFTEKKGYTLPKSVKITMAGATLTDGYTYEDGVLNIDEVYGDTVITATGVKKQSSYKVSFDLYKAKANKKASKVKEGSSYSVKLTPDSGYSLKKSNVSVVVDGVTQVEGYSFDGTTLTIDSIKGRTVIEAVAVKKKKSQKDTTTSKSDGKSDKKSDKKSTTSTSSKKNTTKTNNPTKTYRSNSRSAQALSQTGAKPVNYNRSGYRAPKTGEAFDIRYIGAMAFIMLGLGICFVQKNKKRIDK